MNWNRIFSLSFLIAALENSVRQLFHQNRMQKRRTKNWTKLFLAATHRKPEPHHRAAHSSKVILRLTDTLKFMFVALFFFLFFREMIFPPSISSAAWSQRKPRPTLATETWRIFKWINAFFFAPRSDRSLITYSWLGSDLGEPSPEHWKFIWTRHL